MYLWSSAWTSKWDESRWKVGLRHAVADRAKCNTAASQATGTTGTPQTGYRTARIVSPPRCCTCCASLSSTILSLQMSEAPSVACHRHPGIWYFVQGTELTSVSMLFSEWTKSINGAHGAGHFSSRQPFNAAEWTNLRQGGFTVVSGL